MGANSKDFLNIRMREEPKYIPLKERIQEAEEIKRKQI